jgi:hypothetical protein
VAAEDAGLLEQAGDPRPAVAAGALPGQPGHPHRNHPGVAGGLAQPRRQGAVVGVDHRDPVAEPGTVAPQPLVEGAALRGGGGEAEHHHGAG